VASALVAASIVIGGQAGAATNASAALPWPAGMPRPAVPHCPQGEVPLVPTSGATDGLGVSRFEYASMPGMVVITAPKGLTTRSVTPALLADLGLPTHPGVGTSGNGQAIRQAVALSAQPNARAMCRGTSPITSLPSAPSQVGPLPAGTAAPGIQFTHHFSGIWAGYIVTEAEAGNTINEVNAAWTVDGSHTSTAYAPSSEATWVGIGGGPGDSSSTTGLIQEGTSMRTGDGYQDWYEILGTNGNGCTSDPGPCDAVFNSNVSPGDSVGGEVFWNNNAEACFVFNDNTHTNDSFYACSAIPSGGIYDHTSAEWIDESSVQGGGYDYYDDPGTTYWTDQSLGYSFGGSSAVSSPFVDPYESDVLLVPGTPSTDDGAPAPACSSTGVEAFPTDPVINGSSGSSQIDTCPTGTKVGEDGNT
jgi:hypothetical protein